MDKDIIPSNKEKAFYNDIKTILQKAREKTRRVLNSAMVETYWQIGKRIVEQEQQGKNRAHYRDYLIANLSHYLGSMFGKGFSIANLKNFRQFYIIFQNDQKGYTLCSQLSWSLLKCFVLIDLKTSKLNHQDIGQMDMYVRMFDDLKRGKDDNPTIGIVLCTDKDETIVKYSVHKESRQIFTSKYKLILPTEEELIAELEWEKRLIEQQMLEESDDIIKDE